MTQNRVSPGENSLSVNGPIWTIPVSNGRNDNDNLPTYNHFDTSQSDNLPPNYFDISIVPNVAFLHCSETTQRRETSKAKIERKNGTVCSMDSLVDKNPHQLWLYFMTYLNEKPTLTVHILGQHNEHYTVPKSYRAVGLRKMRHGDHRTRVKTDFNYSIDLTAYVSEHCSRVAVIPTKKTKDINENITFRDALEQYTRSKRRFKKIQCRKQLVGWDLEQLKERIEALVSSTGYRETIRINFVIHNDRIIARSPSKLNRFSQSIWTRILCFLSCLWLLIAPIYFYLRAVSSTRHQITADYAMNTSSEMFLHKNARCIMSAASIRSKEHYLAIV